MLYLSLGFQRGHWGIGVKRGEMRYIHQTNLEFRVGACDDNGDNLLKVSINILNISKWSIIDHFENIDHLQSHLLKFLSISELAKIF